MLKQLQFEIGKVNIFGGPSWTVFFRSCNTKWPGIFTNPWILQQYLQKALAKINLVIETGCHIYKYCLTTHNTISALTLGWTEWVFKGFSHGDVYISITRDLIWQPNLCTVIQEHTACSIAQAQFVCAHFQQLQYNQAIVFSKQVCMEIIMIFTFQKDILK